MDSVVVYNVTKNWEVAVYPPDMELVLTSSSWETDTLVSSRVVTLWFPTNDGTNCLGNSSLVDYNGNYYAAMWLGRQCWMASNLRSRNYADGTPIARGDQDPSNVLYSSSTPYYYYPNGAMDLSVGYGLLYNWKAVMRGEMSSEEIPSGVQGVCPTGWHVPSHAEWMQLKGFVMDQSEYRCDGNSYTIALALSSPTGWKECLDEMCSWKHVLST